MMYCCFAKKRILCKDQLDAISEKETIPYYLKKKTIPAARFPIETAQEF